MVFSLADLPLVEEAAPQHAVADWVVYSAEDYAAYATGYGSVSRSSRGKDWGVGVADGVIRVECAGGS